MFSCLQMANHRSNGTEIWALPYHVLQWKKKLLALEKFCLQWNEQTATFTDTKLSFFAFPSSLFLGTLLDLNMKSQNFRPGNDVTNYQDQSYFAYKFKSSRRGDLSNDTKWWPGGEHKVGFLIKFESWIL